MDASRFDRLIKALAVPATRRSVLSVLASGLATLRIESTPVASAALAQSEGLIALGGTCTVSSDCTPVQPGRCPYGDAICGDNGFVGDGALTCCLTGGCCESDADCCGEQRCIGAYDIGLVCGTSLIDYQSPGQICVTNADCNSWPGCQSECFEQQCRCNPSNPAQPVAPVEYPFIADGEAAMKAAETLSALEFGGVIHDMYRSMHPDAQALIPEQAVVGWYMNEFLHFDEPAPRASKIRFRPWTWEVTGKTYPDTAEIATRQALDDGTIVWDDMRLVKDLNGNWCWFFGKDRQFVVDQIARFVPAEADVAETNVWGVSFGKPCTATIDCGQHGGPTQCVEVLRDGEKQMVCLHGPNAYCASPEDCYQHEGATECVGKTTQGNFRGVCLRAEGATCKSSRDCMESLNCLAGKCTVAA